MPGRPTDRVPLRTSEDVVIARQLVRTRAVELGFRLVDQTKLVTAASELARNTVDHAGGGMMEMEVVVDGPSTAIRLTFVDDGPGIADLELALTDGFTTAGGLGLGLGGAKRLSHEFAVESEPGSGTRVTIARWA